MKIIIRFIIAIVCFTQTYLFAQTNQTPLHQKLPQDKNVIIGKLPNGLSYYIRSNQKPEKRAIFYLAVNAGSILETEDQVGLAHFTEHMGFNGTKQFPGNTLVDELEKKGIVFGREINAYTSFDETVYYVYLPTDDSVLFDMGLKILDGWAFGMLMTEQEIDSERGVIIEEWRTRGGAGDRMRETTLPIELKGSQYVNRLPIGTLENLQQFKYASIRNFYKRWYRPDNMAVVIVGDFDANEMEKMVVDFFTMNDAPTTPLNRKLYSIPNNKKPLIAIATDPEATNTQFTINYKQQKTETHTLNDFRRDLCRYLFTNMLSARISEIAQEKTAPFKYGYSYYRNYWSRSNEAFTNYYNCIEGKSLETFEIALTELQRIKQHGFTQTELERAKNTLLNQYEKRAKEESKKDSRAFANIYGSNFLKNTPIVSDADYYALTSKLLPNIKVEDVNSLIKQWVSDKNITVNYTQPQKEGLSVPTENDFLQLFEKAKKIQTTPYVDQTSDLPFLAKEPKVGKVVKRTDNKEFDYTELKLNNGATVVVKSTDFNNDQIVFSASSFGGISLYPDEKVLNASYAATVIRDCGIGNYDPIMLNKFKSGKNFSVSPWISTYSEGINGSSSVKDLETFMQHLYMIFEAPRKDQNILDKKIKTWKADIETQKNSPDFQFSVKLAQSKFPNDKRNITHLTDSDLEKMNLDEMYIIFKERFSNASDFTFYFVGNIDIESFIPWIEKYIGSISSTSKQEKWIDRSSPFAKGIKDETLFAGIGEKAKFSIATQLDFDWNDKDRMAIRLLNNIVRIKLTEDIREKLGGTYGTSFSLSPSRIPTPKISMNIHLGCDPTRVEELTTAIWGVLDEIIAHGSSEIDLNKAKIQLIRAKELALKNNQNWLYDLAQYYNYQDSILSLNDYQTAVESISIEDIKKVAAYMKHNEYIRIILLPLSMKKE
ncbi:MAG: insulinase family protein [Bacteroidales bacterium]|nr:insulinase family protein [Bacteroidales bacterium]